MTNTGSPRGKLACRSACLVLVLRKLQDRVLYLKHNLDAAALAGLDTKLPELERDVAHLVSEMQASIAEADRFMAQVN